MAPDPPLGAEGLYSRHVPHAIGPATLAGKGSYVTMCPTAPDPPLGVGGLWRRQVSCGTRLTTR
jgi:hypothetical protein